MYPQALSRVVAVQPLLDAVERDPGGASRQAFENLRVGQTVSALVRSQTRDMALVSIEGQVVSMRLPRSVESGETLRLRFAGHLPQPVFTLETPEADAADAPRLSQTARMLSELMQRVPERTPPTLTPPAPLLAQSPASTAELALALRNALVRSGLFYESHLADWVDGRDSLDGLLREPQNRARAEIAARALPDGETGLKQANPLHGLLTQQLQVLESPQFVWRGELWPGRTLEWQVRRDDGDEANDRPTRTGPSAEPAWESRLKLELPALGALDVHIRLDARQNFSIRLAPAAAASVPLLQAGQSALLDRLTAAGCSLQAFEVARDAGA
jgi:hypothetical protein